MDKSEPDPPHDSRQNPPREPERSELSGVFGAPVHSGRKPPWAIAVTAIVIVVVLGMLIVGILGSILG